MMTKLVYGFVSLWLVLASSVYAAKEYPFLPPNKPKDFEEWRKELSISVNQADQILEAQSDFKNKEKLLKSKAKDANKKLKELKVQGAAADDPALDAAMKEVEQSKLGVQKAKVNFNAKVKELLDGTQEKMILEKKSKKKPKKKKSDKF